MSQTAVPPTNIGPSPVWRTLHLLLTPAPGRLRNTLILVAGVSIVLTIWEVFRIPSASIACYVVLFVSRDERTSSVATAKGIAVLGTIATFGAIVIEMAALSEPALRIILMAGLTFGAMFMSRASKPGAAFFGVGFIIIDGLTTPDETVGIALSPDIVGNVSGPGAGLPGILLMPPEDALVRILLWLALCIIIPAAVVILLNKAFGRDPAALLRTGLALRLRAAEAWLRGAPGAATRLLAVARRGSAELAPLVGLAQQEHGSAEAAGLNQARIRAVSRLLLACLAAEQVGEAGGGWRAVAADRCAAILRGDAAAQGDAAAEPGTIGAEAMQALDDYARARPAATETKPPAGFWNDGAFTAPNVQFALKVTLAVMTCYTIQNALDWPQIGTSVVTCFFVALGSLGESGHKMTLRITGALAGGAIGILAIILLMPVMTDIGDLLALAAPVTFIAAWVACGSARVSYAGWQIGLAFFTVILQGFGPTLDMEAGRNRVVGILLGNVVSYVIMSTLWPVRVDGLVARDLGTAFAALAALLRLPRGPADRHAEDATRARFGAAIIHAQTLLADGLYEGTPPGRVRLDEALAQRVQALVIPVALIAADGPQQDRSSLAAWLDDVSTRLQAGPPRTGSLPPPPRLQAEGRGQALLTATLAALPLGPLAPGGD